MGLHPTKPSTTTPRIAVACIPYSPQAAVWIASKQGTTKLSGHRGFVEWASKETAERLVWLSPNSAPWDVVIPALARNKLDMTVHKRGGTYAGVRVRGGEERDGETPRRWYGQSSAGMIEVSPGLCAEDEATETYLQLAQIHAALGRRWPGIGLESSPAGVGLDILRRNLSRELSCSKWISRELRIRGAYGGGRIESYAEPGTVHDVFEIDMKHAYPSIMMAAEVPGQYTHQGTESQATDRLSITTAIVDCPESNYPPLRVERNGEVYYPTGRILGTWPAYELRCAIACGARIVRVLDVFRFEDRSDDFSRFAQDVVGFRRENELEPCVSRYAKSVAVQAVGALGSLPSFNELVVNPVSAKELKIDRIGVYKRQTFAPSRREVISSAIAILGACRGVLAKAIAGESCVYTHTDGFACKTYPQSLPGEVPWKVEAATLEFWASNRRITEYVSGRKAIACGGIHRGTSEDRARELMRETSSKLESKRPNGRAPRACEVFGEALSERMARL